MRPLFLTLLLIVSLPLAAQSSFTPEVPVAPAAYFGLGKYPGLLNTATAGDQTLIAWTWAHDSAVHALRVDRHATPLEEEHVIAEDPPDDGLNPQLATVGDHWLVLSYGGGVIRATAVGADGKPAGTSTIRSSIAAGARWTFSTGGDRIMIVVSEFIGVTGYVVDGSGKLVATTPRLLATAAQIGVAGSGSDFIVRMQPDGGPYATYVRLGLDGSVLNRRDLSNLHGEGGMTWDGRQYFAWAQTLGGAEAMVLGADLSIGPMFGLTAAHDTKVDWIAPTGSGIVVGSSREVLFPAYRRLLFVTRVIPTHDPAADLPLDENVFISPSVGGRGDDLLMVWTARQSVAVLAVPVDTETLAPTDVPRMIIGRPLVAQSWTAAGEEGKLFALWEERADDKNGFLMARLFNRAGALTEPKSLGYGTDFMPALTFDGQRYWAAWFDDGRVEVQHFDRDGAPPFNRLAFPVSPAGAVPPDITSISIGTGGGRVVAVWALANGATEGVTFDADPQFFRPTLFEVSPSAVANLGATLAVNGDRALVAWLRPEPPQGVPVEAAPRDIVVTAMTLSGLPISPVALPVAPALAGRGRPAAATDGHTFLVVWWDPDGEEGVVRASTVSADGIPGPPRTIVRTAAADAAPALIWSAGSYRLSWTDGGRAMTQRLASDGAPIGGPSVLWSEGTHGVQVADFGDGFAALAAHPAPDPALPPFDRLFLRFSLPTPPRVRAVR